MSAGELAQIRRRIHEALVTLAAPEADRVRGLVAELEKAVRRDATGLDICEIPHESIEEEDLCDAQRLEGADRLSSGRIQVSEGAKRRYSEEYLRRINQGRRT